MQDVKTFKPKIVAFCCNWCSYAGADLAGTNRLNYPADVKIIRVPCSCRVNPMFILRAFQRGADGVILCGCHPGDCHYTSGNYYARRRLETLKEFLPIIGIEPALKPATEAPDHGRILVMATDITLSLDKYHELAETYGKGCEVISVPCPGLAGRIEHGDLGASDLVEMIRGYVGSFAGTVGSVVLSLIHI